MVRRGFHHSISVIGGRSSLRFSTQCGFASAGPGNQISENVQENKLRLVGEVADRVLGVRSATRPS